MKHLTQSLALAAVVATGAFGAMQSASAQPYSRYYSDRDYPEQYAHPEHHRGYAQNEDHDRDVWRHGCRAASWDPNARYMPGDAVWRNGKLYVATDVSSHVYNVNSPPEWTPNYWVRAHCR